MEDGRRRAVTMGDAENVSGEEVAPFSPGILVDGTWYISGTIGIDATTDEPPEKFEDEVRACLEKMGQVLASAGMGFGDLVWVQVFLTDVTLWRRLNAVYVEMIPAPRPARAAVEVTALPIRAARVEMSGIARRVGEGLEVVRKLGGEGPRADEVGAGEGGEEVIEGVLIGEVDHGSGGGEGVLGVFLAEEIG